MSDWQDPAAPAAGSEPGPDHDESIGALLSRLVDDGEDFVRGEIRLYRAQAMARLVEARSAVAMIAAAGMIGLATTIALLVGLIVILIPYLGRIGAVALVIGVSLLIAWILLQTGLGKLRRATDLDTSPADPNKEAGL